MDDYYPEWWKQLNDAIEAIRADKPSERGELARRYAVALTQLEIIRAYIVVDVLNYNEFENE